MSRDDERKSKHAAVLEIKGNPKLQIFSYHCSTN